MKGEKDKDEEIQGEFEKRQTEPLPSEPYKRTYIYREGLQFDDRDREIVIRMASKFCPHEDIADVLDISRETLVKYFQRELALAKGAAKESLRTSQLRRAHQGSDTQLKWLGMQYLGQSDKLQTENTNRDFVIDDNDGPSQEPTDANDD